MQLPARGGCNGRFAAAPQCRISVLARDVVFADPWLGRRGSLLASFAAGCGNLERIDPRDRRLGRRRGPMRAAAQVMSNAPDFLQALAAMWRPLVLVLAAAYLLFSNDQGRELGVSLMAENSGWRLFFLFLALIYWATNNWHTARLGLRAAVQRRGIPVPQGDEKWLFWPPRLLGVCAHLFAAINLSLAAAHQPEFAASWLWPVAWTAPLAIVLATALAWALIVFCCRSERPSKGRDKIGAAIRRDRPARRPRGRRLRVPKAPRFSLGHVWISVSAVVFLSASALLRRRRPLGAEATAARGRSDDRREKREIPSSPSRCLS